MSQEMLIGQILRALSNHSELVTQAYTQGRVQTESSTNIQLLVNSGLLQGNTSDGFRLVAPLRDIAYFGDCDRLFRDNPITSVSRL